MLRRTNTKGRHDGHISSTMSEALHFPPHISVFWADSRPIPKLIKRGNSCKLVPSDLTKYSKISWSNLQMFRHLPIIWVSCIAAQIIQWNFCSLSTLSHWITSGFTDVEAIKNYITKKKMLGSGTNHSWHNSLSEFCLLQFEPSKENQWLIKQK